MSAVSYYGDIAETERLPDPSDDELQGAADALREDFAMFARWAWPIVQPGRALRWGRHMDAVCLHLQAVAAGRITHLVITIPPRFSKSTLVSVIWPAWMLARNPSWQGLCTSHDAQLSMRDSVTCRELTTHPEYRALFPYVETKSDQKMKSYWATTKGGHRIATSVGAGVTGLGGDAIIIDDPIAAKKAWSDAHRQAALDHVQRVLPSRINDQTRPVMILIMQRVHEDDPAAWAIEQGWDHLNLTMEYDPVHAKETSIGWRDWRTTPGELLDPVRFPASVVTRMRRAMLPMDYAAQYQQHPVTPGGNIVKESWIKSFAVLDWTPPMGARWILSCDLRAGGKSKSSSFAVLQVWAAAGPDRYLVDQDRGRWDIVETIARIESICERWPQIGAKVIEDKADGRPVQRMLRDRLPGIVMHSPVGDKKSRFQAVAHMFHAGNIFIASHFRSGHDKSTPKGCVYELTTFDAAPNDDQVDATSQALEYLGGAVADWSTAAEYSPPSRVSRGRNMF